MFQRLLSIPAVLLLSCSLSQAQMVKDVMISTLAFGESVEGVFFKNDGKAEPLIASTSNLSPPFAYSGTRGIIFYASEADLKNGTPEYGRVVLPTDASRVLLTFTPNPVEEDDPDEEEAAEESVDDEEEEQAAPQPVIEAISMSGKPGSYRFFNQTNKSVEIEVDGEKSSLVPDAEVVLESPSWTSEPGSLEVSINESAEEEGEKGARLLSSVWGHRPERRYHIFIRMTDDRFQKIKVLSYYDVP